MADKIVVVGGREMVLGFNLVGVTDSRVVVPEAAEDELAKLFEQTNVGIVILQDAHYNSLSQKIKRKIELVSKPVVVTVGTNKASSSDDLQRLIKRAIGISLDKQK